MRKLVMAVVGLIAVCSLSFAQEKTEGAKPVPQPPKHSATKTLNNVVKMDAAGTRTALCLCGKEFTVTDKSPNFDQRGTHYYLCSDECKGKTGSATKEELTKMVGDWKNSSKAYKTPENTVKKDGKKWATCACGKEFEVGASSEFIKENGVKMYLCSDDCMKAMTGMGEQERMTKELALLKPAEIKPELGKPIEVKAPETKATEMKPQEVKPTEKPMEKPTEPKPPEPKPTVPKPNPQGGPK
jgi:hypothetical protein